MRKFENNIGSILSTPKYSECYANLAKNRIIFLSEIVSKDVASTLSALLFYYDNESHDDISIYINTNGGDSDALSNIYDVMQMIKSPIRTICIGKAYSAGAFILAAGAKGKRFITKNADVMIHGVQFEFPGPYTDQCGSKIYFDMVRASNKKVLETLAKHTGKTYKEIEEDCKKDLFLDAKQAKAYGIVDTII